MRTGFFTLQRYLHFSFLWPFLPPATIFHLYLSATILCWPLKKHRISLSSLIFCHLNNTEEENEGLDASGKHPLTLRKQDQGNAARVENKNNQIKPDQPSVTDPQAINNPQQRPLAGEPGGWGWGWVGCASVCFTQ